MPEPPVDILRRWEDSGAEWRLESLAEDHATVMLCTCTGEPVERLESDDADLIAFVRARLDD
jgi:hypothetical protein